MPHSGLAYLVLIALVAIIGLPITIVAEKITGKTGRDARGINDGIYTVVGLVLVIWIMVAAN